MKKAQKDRHNPKHTSVPAAQPAAAHSAQLAQVIALCQAGKFDDSEPLCSAVLAADPHNMVALNLLGIIRFNQGRHEETIAALNKAIAVNARFPDAHYYLGMSLAGLKRYEEAVTSFDKAIALNPGYADALFERGTALRKLKRHDEAIASFDNVLALDPRHAKAYNNRGLALHHLKRYDEALTQYDKALAIDPNYAGIYHNLGFTLKHLKRYDEAMASYDKAIALNPDYADVYWNKSLLHLMRGNYEEGWKLYEWRMKRSEVNMMTEVPDKPLWLGTESLAGKTIMLHAEQGFGDAIQFCRYVPMVEALGAKVILGVPSPLTGLMSSLKGVHTLLGQGTYTMQFDFHAPMLSLPLAFGTTLATIPAEVPYLYADKQKQLIWQERLEAKSKPRVGLMWSGSAHPDMGYERSVLLELLAPLMDMDLEFHALQKEIRPEDKIALKGSKIVPHMDELKDFTDTAALIAEMDLIISVDTSIAHLAGALGKKTWVLLHETADFRWLLDREDSPWYPTVKLFRQQKPGDWAGVIEKVRVALTLFMAS